MRQRYEYLSPRSNPAVIFGCPLLHHSWADPPSWAARARIVLADLKVLRTGGRPSHLIFREPRYDEVHRHLTSAAWARRQRELLSRPTLRRSTPITTTALAFVVRVGPEGAIEMRIAG